MVPNKAFVQELIKKRDWTESEPARRMGVSRSKVSRFLHGERLEYP